MTSGPTHVDFPPPGPAREVKVPPSDLVVRDSTADDVEALTAIYAWHVAHGTGTFEMEAPPLQEMHRRRDDVVGCGLPWLVATRGMQVVGYAYANVFRPRPAYRFCLEDSIYLAHDAAGHGIGRALLSALIERCTAWGGRQMVAVIGDSANAASIGVHAALGFERSGTMQAAGRKFGRWIDVVFMQRSLGDGARTAPAGESQP